jgi:uncharacterized protein (TIGR03118 family)
MHVRRLPARSRFVVLAITITVLLLMALPIAASAHPTSGGSVYQQTNLVSDIPGVAKNTDPNLVNPWGIAFNSTGPVWIADNGTGVSTLYNGQGRKFPLGSPLVVTIPPPAGGTSAAPTGIVFNPFNSTDTDGFVVSANGTSGPSFFLFDTEDGTISGWNPNVDITHAVIAVDNSASGAVYKGLAIGSTTSGEFIYAANFHAGTIDVYNEHFAPATLSGSFKDPGIPAGYAPFNITNLGGKLYVTYAKQDVTKHDDVSGPGHGFLDVFDTNGKFIKRLVTRAPLNSPWGMALAPSNFGQFSNDLLVGNFGNGRINAFNPKTGAFLGQLRKQSGAPITIDDLWGLAFGNGALAGQTNQLFFTAGIGDEQHGLFGSITSSN